MEDINIQLTESQTSSKNLASDKQQLESAIADLEKKVTALSQELEVAQASASGKSELSGQLSSQAEQLESLAKQNEVLSSRCEQLTQQLSAQAQSNSEMEQAWKASEVTIQQQKQQLAEMQESQVKLLSESKMLQEKVQQ